MKSSCWLIATFVLTGPSAAAEVDFAHDVVPILREHCDKCHTGDQKKGGLSFNTREALLTGGENGAVVVAGKSGQSDLMARLTSDDKAAQMPPEGARVPQAKIAILKQWIDAGLPWQEGFRFGPRGYEPPLAPRRPDLPSAVEGRDHPIDRIIDSYLQAQKLPRPEPLSDAAFARRVYLDLIGLLPTPEELQAFEADSASDKRERLVAKLLARDVDYAEHWLTFWNDLLRNDYSGTGFITGGRQQITAWLYDALVTDKPYDQFSRELIAPPTPASAGFIQGIRWRGDVSAGQTVEIQFAQSLGQSLLGINLKCASCHDSFIDRWTLEESYGLAAIYSERPLEIHRCDKPIGKTAQAAWLFPETGRIDPQAPQPERLKQLAGLMTAPENGRFTRTIVNRLWHRLMGRGIVHPTDAMQTEPWSADLLDYLAVNLADNGYNLKKTLALIATSQAYQSQAQVVAKGIDDQGYHFAGPRAKRLTAEQFLDGVWQVTGSAPARYDAPIVRGAPGPQGSQPEPLAGKWIWSQADTTGSPAGETVVFTKKWEIVTAPTQAIAVITCDNRYTLYVNGQKVAAGENWEQPDLVPIGSRLKAGSNELVIVAENAGNGPNPAGLLAELRLFQADGSYGTLASDDSWQWTRTKPDANGRFKQQPTDWQPAAIVSHQDTWAARANPAVAALLARGANGAGLMVRASLLKSDFLMRSLGRPNRDQIVSVRPSELTTLEAIDLSNGQTLADALARGAKNLAARKWESPATFVRWLYRFALSREPSNEERQILNAALGDSLTEQGIEDALWSVIMLPEFQLVR